MRRSFAYVTVDVFTNTPFGGNPLAVFTDARGMSDTQMQSLAAEMNYSETAFVLPPSDPNHTARVRIFSRIGEMAFAGHPNVGTGCVLAQQGRDREGKLYFEEIAGLVTIRVIRDPTGMLVGAHIDAPQPLSIGMDLAPQEVAACVGLATDDICVGAHPPRFASVGLPFCIAEVRPETLSKAQPDLAKFKALARKVPDMGQRLPVLLYAPVYAPVPGQPSHIRARMFSPLSGTVEDPATGSASAALAALRLSLGNEPRIAFEVMQGAEIGRPSLLYASAERDAEEIRASVGGGCVWILRGEATL